MKLDRVSVAAVGWNVYFPHRDRSLDFIISKTGLDGCEIRPVQVKRKYPTNEKGNQNLYGYVGGLNQIHPDMVLAIPCFSGKRARNRSPRNVHALWTDKASQAQVPLPTRLTTGE